MIRRVQAALQACWKWCDGDGYYRFDDLMARFHETIAIHDYYYSLCEDELEPAA